MQDINFFINQVLSSKEIRKETVKKCEVDSGYFEDNFMGTIRSDLLLKVIEISYKDKDIRNFLGFLLYFCDAESVTNVIFRKLLRYPSKMKRTYLTALGHCPLSFYQLSVLCKKNVGTEAVCQMLDRIAFNNCFTAQDLQYFLKMNRCYGVVLKYQVEELLKVANKLSEEKLRILNNYARMK